jgi:hypothetical protein
MTGMHDLTEDLARKLRRTGMGGVAAVLLEAAGPLALIGAQAAYIVEPLFGGEELHSIGRVLEDPKKVRLLIDQLRADLADNDV